MAQGAAAIVSAKTSSMEPVEMITKASHFLRYCKQHEELYDLLINVCPATKGQRKWMVPLSEIWELRKTARQLK